MSDLKIVRPTDGEMYLRWCKGDVYAARLIGSLALVSQVADDFVDGDNPKTTGSFAQRSAAMSGLLAAVFADVIPNPYFQQHKEVLLPLIVSSIVYWDASNDWAISEKKETRMFGFVHREASERVVAMVALLIGGWDHQRAVVREMHEHYHGKSAVESYEQWEEKEAQCVDERRGSGR